MNIKQSFRILFRNKTYSILNIVGLSIGLAVVLLICLMVYHERSFDKSFQLGDRIYRLNSYLVAYQPGETYASTSNKSGPALQELVPEMETTVRTYPITYLVRINDEPRHLNVMWADEDFFRLFDTPFLQGRPEDVMKQPNAIAISEQMAKTLFGNDNPMGKTLSLRDDFTVEVKAVYKDYPKNSSFHYYRVIAPFMHSNPSWIRDNIHWGNIDFETFVLLAEHTGAEQVNRRLEELHEQFAQQGQKLFYIPRLQALKDIHLYSGGFAGTRTSFQSDIGTVRMLGLLAVIILLIACANYMNLSTARAQKRVKEIGVSKTLGATRSGLIGKLFLETGVITAVSFVLAFVLAYFLLPLFNSLLNAQLVFSQALDPVFLGITLLLWALTTLLAACYPAFYLSSFPPLLAIRAANVTRGSSHAVVRRVLTVAQFSVAVVLIAWVLVIHTQIRYVNNKDLGYNPHKLLFVAASGNTSEAMAEECRALSFVESVGRESVFLFNGNGNTLHKDMNDENGVSLLSMGIDREFISTMQLKLIAGTNLRNRLPGDTLTQALLNRKAVEYLEMTPEEVIGKIVMAEIYDGTVQVCGVVENFNFEPLYRPVSAICLHNGANRPLPWIVIRMKGDDLPAQLKTIEEIYKKHHPNGLFTASFADDYLQKEYAAERRTNYVVICFSILAIFVACMGVFGLTAFMAEQRTKEIGIRKVMGAGVRNIVGLFTTDYLKLLGISLVVALPVAWWLGSNYLNNFAYRISLSWWMFAAAAFITIAITIATVCLQALKAAMANPVKSIKTE